MRHLTVLLCPTLLCCVAVVPLAAQTAPAEGLRQNTPAVHALTNVRIVQSPGKVIENGTLVLRDGVIESVGAVAPPADARVWDMKGMTVYPGFIDAYSAYGLPPRPERGGEEAKFKDERGSSYWNAGVRSHQRAASLFVPDAKSAEKFRSQGFTSALIVPTRGFFKGSSALVGLGDRGANDELVRRDVAHHITFERDPGIEGYPGSLMGVIALIRQTLYDADWHRRAHEAYARNPRLTRPEAVEQLDALQSALQKRVPVVLEATDELNFLRACKVAQEFGLQAMVRGSGDEYKRLDAIKAQGVPVLLPINFPDAPPVQTPEEALQATLAQLRHWDEAPENPARLHAAGVSIALTSATLKDPGTFLKNLRTAVERGLLKDAALAALTTTPARLFGVERQLGTLEPGKAANLIVVEGDVFDAKGKIRESWIDGRRYEVKPLPEVDPRGKWHGLVSGVGGDSLILHLKGEPEGIHGTIRRGKDAKLTNVSYAALRLSFSFPGDSLGFTGLVRMTANVYEQQLLGTGEWSDGKAFVWSAARIAPHTPEPDTAQRKPPAMASFPPVYPHGEFGRPKLPAQPDAVLVRNATVWTCGPQGKLENADVLVRKGKVQSVSRNLPAPPGAVVIDGTGKHVTPGIIDAHSHMAISAGVNEAGQAISAEVRIGDVVNSDDISMYRALAGGLTSAHLLHGSANPIGGQSQLIKLRWGALPEELKFEGAPPTIKFALGENVKQSNWGDSYTTRYPQTRMGVEQIMRDEFKAALDYERAWQKYEKDKNGIPPRQDLELDAVLEILRGRRFVHCHSYRQDEILAMMRVAEEFGFRIRVFQHILEGYKVADVMAKHGAGGSSFTDWWAYKLEVYDAIPHNGALMHNEGVLVSFNSDDNELARRLNLEAAKAVKYGGVPEEDALKFVTLNPAKQLKVDHRVGSLDPGKDADFVIWNGHPLSTYTMCEQTWIDGRKYFDREEDRQLNDQVAEQRAVLVQKALTAKPGGAGPPASKPEGSGDTYDHGHPHHNDPFGGGR